MVQWCQYMNRVERWSRRRGKAIINAAVLCILGGSLTGCLTTELTSSSPTRENHFERTFTEPTQPVQSSAASIAKNRAEAVTPIKQPQKAAEAPKPKVEPIAQTKLVITSPKNVAPDTARKAPMPVAAANV